MNDSTGVDPGRCPLCGEANACARAGSDAGAGAPCWCVAETFTPALLAAVPPPARGRACICPRCAETGRGSDAGCASGT